MQETPQMHLNTPHTCFEGARGRKIRFSDPGLGIYSVTYFFLHVGVLSYMEYLCLTSRLGYIYWNTIPANWGPIGVYPH